MLSYIGTPTYLPTQSCLVESQRYQARTQQQQQQQQQRRCVLVQNSRFCVNCASVSLLESVNCDS